jgi:DNA-binding transcriptional MerR regulator
MTDEWLARTDANKYFSEDAEERQAVVKLLHRFDINIETIYAMAMSSNAPSIAMVERMLSNRKSWRSNLLKDHERRQQQIEKAYKVSFSATGERIVEI